MGDERIEGRRERENTSPRLRVCKQLKLRRKLDGTREDKEKVSTQKLILRYHDTLFKYTQSCTTASRGEGKGESPRGGVNEG